MVDGTYNPGQLVTVRELVPGTVDPLHPRNSFDTAFYRDNLAHHPVVTDPLTGVTTVTHNAGNPGAGGIFGLRNPSDGTDRLTHIERLQFNDQVVILAPGNNQPVGSLTISDTTPTVGQTVTVSAAGITDLDNVSPTNPTGAVTSPISFFLQQESHPGSGIFEDMLVRNGFGVETPIGPSLVVPDLTHIGLAMRVMGIYTDAHGVQEMVFSALTAPIQANVAPVITTLGGGTTGSASIKENTTAVTTVTATDANPGDVVTYSIAGGADAALFAINASLGALTFLLPPDFETPASAAKSNVYDVIVKASDGLQFDTQDITVTVTNVPGVTLNGTAGNDTLTGTGEEDTLNGLAGDDTLLGLGGPTSSTAATATTGSTAAPAPTS